MTRFWGWIAELSLRRSRPLLALLLALTLGFGAFLLRVEVDTNFLSFVSPQTRALVQQIEDDFAEGSYLTLIFESRSQRSLLEPELLHQQLRILREIRAGYPVTSFSLVEGIDAGLRRVKRRSLLETDDYSSIAESILGLAGGRTVRDLEKVTAHFVSHPEAIEFYARLRIAQGAAPVDAPGAPHSTWAVPYVQAIKSLVRVPPGGPRHARREMLAAIRNRAEALSTPELAVYGLNDDVVSYDIDRDTQRNTALLGLTMGLVDAFCVLALLRSARELGLVAAILSCACIWTFGLAGALHMPLSFLHLLGVPILLGTGIDDSLAFGRRMAEERAAGQSFEQALRATYASGGDAIFLTSLTTCLGFVLAALTSSARVVASFFLLFSASMAFAWLLTVLFQGALRVEFARRDERRGRPVASVPRAFWLEPLTRWQARAARRALDAGARPALLVGGALLVLGLAGITQLRADLSRRDVVKPGMPTYAANEVMQRYFGDFRVGYVLFEGAVEDARLLVGLKELERRLAQVPEIEQVLGSANVDSVTSLIEKQGIAIAPGMDARAAFERVRASERTADYALDMSFRDAADYVLRKRGERYDGLLLRFFVAGEAGSRVLGACAAIRREIAAQGLDAIPGVRWGIGGGDIIYPMESVVYVDNLSRSFFLSLLGNWLVLLAFWRRLAPSLVAMLPIVLATALVVGSMPVFGVTLNPLNLGIGAIVVGLGIDYPIHVFERYAEERRRGRTARDAAAQSLEALGPQLLGAMLTTVLGFGASCVVLLPMSTSFGLLTGAAIGLVYLATLFLLPALLVRLPEPERKILQERGAASA